MFQLDVGDDNDDV